MFEELVEEYGEPAGCGELGSEFFCEFVEDELLRDCWERAGDERFRRARTLGLGTDSDEDADHNACHEINCSSIRYYSLTVVIGIMLVAAVIAVAFSVNNFPLALSVVCLSLGLQLWHRYLA